MKRVIITLFFIGASVITYAQVQGQQAPPPVPPGHPLPQAHFPTADDIQPKMPEDPNAPKFKFKAGDTYDFGNLQEGPVAEHVFEFVNAGKEPLIIQTANASCGCTTPEWPKEAILPGKKGKITVHFTTIGHLGPFSKEVSIQSNASANGPYILHIKGTVQPASTEKPQKG